MSRGLSGAVLSVSGSTIFAAATPALTASTLALATAVPTWRGERALNVRAYCSPAVSDWSDHRSCEPFTVGSAGAGSPVPVARRAEPVPYRAPGGRVTTTCAVDEDGMN